MSIIKLLAENLKGFEGMGWFHKQTEQTNKLTKGSKNNEISAGNTTTHYRKY